MVTFYGLLLSLLCANLSLAGFFEDELDYISRVYPEETATLCPNLPYYGGLQGLLGKYAHQCTMFEMMDSGEVILETTDSVEANDRNKPFYAKIDETINKPVILLWTHRMANRIGYIKDCPNSQCVITENRNWFNHSLTKAIYFYGSLFNIDDLPLPRKPNHMWILTHEESPKNKPIFSYDSMMRLFNITSTIRQESTFPLTTQYLRSMDQLESNTYVKTFTQKTKYQEDEALAPIIYVQSDCDVPSDRDKIVKWMMKYIKIDSYGKCVNNKKLPSHLQDPIKGMDHKEFIELVSKYKFAISMENGICNDYITEKFWRPLIVGTVPIVLGAPNVKEFAPTAKSIIDIRDFKTIKELANTIKNLENNEEAYDEYRTFKETGSTNRRLETILNNRNWEPDFDALGTNLEGTKGNFMNHFDCYTCDIIHENNRRESVGEDPIRWKADKSHYGCPLPMEYTTENDLTKQRPYRKFWYSAWMASYCDMKALLQLSDGGTQQYSPEYFTSVSRRCLLEKHWKRDNLD